MVRAVISSVLQDTLAKLPEDFVMKSDSVANVLLKRGVTPDELKFSGLEANLPKGQRVTKSDLQSLLQVENPRVEEMAQSIDRNLGEQAAQSFRKDPSQLKIEARLPRTQFKTVEDPEQAYLSYSLPRALQEGSNYKEKILQFKETLNPDRYRSNHFQDIPDYLLHTRTFDDEIAGQPTHVVQEIQSDLFQQARQEGFGVSELTESERSQLSIFVNAGSDKDAQAAGFSNLDELEDFAMEILIERNANIADLGPLGAAEDLLLKQKTGIPESPYQKTWLRKGIEREVADAVQSGKPQIAIPIKGAGIEQLQRAPGVQKWYETQVLNTAKKVAKSIGGEFKLVEQSVDSRPLHQKLSGDFLEDIEVLSKTSLPGADKMAADVFSNPETTEEVLQSALKVFKETGANLNVPGGVDDFAESLGISKFEANRLAEALDSIKTADGTTQYATIIPPPGKDLGFKLFTPVSAGIFSSYLALREGFTEDQVKQHLIDSEGFSEEEAAEVISRTSMVDQALAEGHSEEDIKNFLMATEHPQETETISFQPESAKPTPPTELNLNDLFAADELHSGATRSITSPQGREAKKTSEFVAQAQALANDQASILLAGRGFFGDQDAIQKLEEGMARQNAKVLEIAKARGLDLVIQDGEFLAQTEQGLVQVTPSIIENLATTKFETGGAIAGAIAGGRFGAQAAGAHPLAKAAGLTVGSIVGAAAGSVVGSQADYLQQAIDLQEELNGTLALRKAMSAAETSVVLDVLGLGLFKAGGAVFKGLRNAFNTVKDGNTQGAFNALKETMFISDDQAAEIVRRWEKLNQKEAPGKSDAEKALSIVPITQPGGESIIKTASVLDSRASSVVSNEISQRANSLIEQAGSLTEKDIGRVLRTDLADYTQEVKDFYGAVKESGAKHPNMQAFQFNAERLTIKPVLDELKKNITDPTLLKRFNLQTRQALQASKDRTFSSLIELRQLVNDFRFNSKIAKKKDAETLKDIVGRIDGEIENAVTQNMGPTAGKQWLENWRTARAQYAQMKALEKNVLARAVNRPGVSEDTIAKALTKYVESIDDTFVDVMAKIPAKTVAKVEGRIFQNLVDQFTTGVEGELRATHFPLLASKLGSVPFKTADAKRVKQAVLDMAEIYRNDVNLAKASGNITIPKFQSYLTTDPVVRLKYEVASSAFNGVKKLAPGKQAETIALVHKVGKLLENPLDPRLVKEVTDALPADVGMEEAVRKLQIEATKRRAAQQDIGTPRVKLYRSGGGLWSPKKTGGTITPKSVPLHRISRLDHAEQVLGKEIPDIRRLSVDEKQILVDQGFQGLSSGEDVILFF